MKEFKELTGFDIALETGQDYAYFKSLLESTNMDDVVIIEDDIPDEEIEKLIEE